MPRVAPGSSTNLRPRFAALRPNSVSRGCRGVLVGWRLVESAGGAFGRLLGAAVGTGAAGRMVVGAVLVVADAGGAAGARFGGTDAGRQGVVLPERVHVVVGLLEGVEVPKAGGETQRDLTGCADDSRGDAEQNPSQRFAVAA